MMASKSSATTNKTSTAATTVHQQFKQRPTVNNFAEGGATSGSALGSGVEDSISPNFGQRDLDDPN
jgi:hypothetical protein